jgi:GR25 family glycosyltransferase involved in LPS biosynthesis
MIIDIREIPVYYINMNSEIKRKEAIELMLQNAGFKNVMRYPGSVSHHPSIGCALSHQSLLNLLIEEKIHTPFLILEDDAVISKDFASLIKIPDDSDAVYLGLSTSARMWNYTVADHVAEKINEDYYQIYNQLAAHAILYTNIDYVKFLAKAIKLAIRLEGHQDIVRATTMKYFNVYAKNKPLFFQNDQDRRVDLQTSMPLEAMKIVVPNSTNLGFACSCHRHV